MEDEERLKKSHFFEKRFHNIFRDKGRKCVAKHLHKAKCYRLNGVVKCNMQRRSLNTFWNNRFQSVD
jgi:hypothetical protein